MYVCWISFLTLTLVTVSYSSRFSKDSCFNGKHSSCHCEVISSSGMSGDLYPDSEASITCDGLEAIKAADDVLQHSEKSYVFTELKILSSEVDNLLHLNSKRLSSIKRLILMHHDLEEINPTWFSKFINLESLDLSENQIVEVDENAFQNLNNLKNLSLANNKIESIASDAFLPLNKLLHLDLSQNELLSMNTNWFSGLEKLVYFSFSNNKLHDLNHDMFRFLPSLQTLDLAGNELENLNLDTFFSLKSLKHLSLATNKLHSLHEHIFKGNKQLEHVNLTGNPWDCNSQMLPFLDWLKLHEVDKSYCFDPPDFVNYTLQTGLLIVNLEVRLQESLICNASMCNCTVSKDKQVVTVDCIGRGFTKLPESLPYKTRVLDLRSNSIRSLSMDHVNSTQWADVSFLHLNNNLIDSLKGLEGTWLLRNLVALHLTNNQLTEIPIHILEQFKGGLLDELYLSGNPWNCDCNTVRFQTWLQDNYRTIKDFDGIRCSADSGIYSNQPIFRLLKSQLCPQVDELINYLDVLNGLMAVAILLIIMKLLFDFWLQKRTGKLPRFFSLNLS